MKPYKTNQSMDEPNLLFSFFFFFLKYKSQIENQVREYSFLGSTLFKISGFTYPNISPKKVLYHMFLTFVIRCGCDRLAIGFIITHAISVYRH